MPSKNPKTGKALSGGAKRAAAKKRASSYKAAVAAVVAAPVQVVIPGSADFDRLAPAPIGDSATAIAWTNDAVLLALDQVLRDPALTNLERWRWISTFGGVLGHLRDKAAEQLAIKKSLASQQTAAQAQGTVSARGRSKTTVSRPPS